MFTRFITYCACSAHTDIVAGLGGMDNAKGVCFKQLLVDAYTWECCREYLKPVDITEEKLGLDALRDIGPRGTFLTHRHTRKYLRRELIQFGYNVVPQKRLAGNASEIQKTVSDLLMESISAIHIVS